MGPRMRRASCKSLGTARAKKGAARQHAARVVLRRTSLGHALMVTRLAWIAHRLQSSNSLTMKSSMDCAVCRVTSALAASARDAARMHLLERQQRLRGPAVRVIRQVIRDFAHLHAAGCVSAPGTAAEAALPCPCGAVRARGPVPALLPRPRGLARGNAPGGRTAVCGPAGRCSSGTCESLSAHVCLAGSGTAFAAWRRPGRPQQARLRA